MSLSDRDRLSQDAPSPASKEPKQQNSCGVFLKQQPWMKRLPTPILAFGQSRLDHRLPLRSHAYGQLSQGVLPKAIPTVCRSTQPSRGVCSPNSSDPWREMPPVMTGSAKPSTRPGILPATPHRPTGKRFSQQQSL